MEINTLPGTIIGLIGNFNLKDDYNNMKIKDILGEKSDKALKIVNLTIDENTLFNDLATDDKNKVILAKKLNDEVIILNDFTKGFNHRERLFYKNLLKKISTYNRKIILISNDIDFFIKLVDHIYVIENNNIIYETENIFEDKLYEYVDKPKIIEFVSLAKDKGINIDYYEEFNDLLKAIYRLKS